MKYRIVETKDDNGKSWFEIERKCLLWWFPYYIDKVYYARYKHIEREHFLFQTREKAEEALRRTMRKRTHRGVAIYPTVEPNEFYVLKWKKEAEIDLPVVWYDYLIYGSYEYCCKEIDRELKAEEMRKFKVERLERGECIISKEPGNSMTPILESREPVVLEPETDWNAFSKGDIVFAKIKGNFYTHLVHGVDKEKGILLGNNHGHVQGWTKKVYARAHLIPKDLQKDCAKYLEEFVKNRKAKEDSSKI